MRFFVRSKLIVMLSLVVPALLLVAACGPSAPSAPAAPIPAEATVTDAAPAAAPPEADTTGNAEMGSGAGVPESVVAVSFTNDNMTPKTIRVKQGDQVTLNLESDRPGSFHIHGYDLEQEVAVGEVTPFRFLANATGRFGINFHGVAEPEVEMPGTMDMGGKTAEASMDGMEPAGGGHDMGSMSDGAMGHGSMHHGPAESAVPVSLNISAEAAEDGGIHVAINAEGWRWAPEEVNGANSEGAGHAHIYADGEKLSRVYGEYHYVPGLEAGPREIMVSLNSNDHSELTWQGAKLESTVTVTVPEMEAMDHHDMGLIMESVEAGDPMSLEAIVHEDALGGYNLQVIPAGFEFSPSLEQGHEPGKGHARLFINGEEFNRLYVPWLQVPAQGEGTHTFTVALMNSEGQPYQYNKQPVEASVVVHEEAKAEVADHHGGSATEPAAGGHHGGGPVAAAQSPSGHHQNGTSGHDHGSGAGASGNSVELEVGYLEVLP